MKKKYTTLEKILPLLLEACSTNHAMLQVIINELSKGNQVKEKKMMSTVNELKAGIFLDIREDICFEMND